jgi:hypothetical protein
VTLLDPRAAAAAGAPHGQLASALADGGLALSCHKLVEDGARATILLAPGLFRLDVRPVEDTLQVTTRSLHDAPMRWSTSETQFSEYHDKPEGREPSVVRFTFVVDAEPFPVAGRISLASTVDRDGGPTHFVAHAIVRQVPPA